MKAEKVSANGIDMSYICFGNGPKPFVILPGLSTKSVLLSAKAIQSSYRMFENDYTVYVFDRRDNMPEDYSVRQMGDDTAEIMKHIGIKDAYIFGASQGGMMAMCIAVDYPELVEKLVLGSTAAKATDRIRTDRWLKLAEKRDMTALTAAFIDDLYSQDTIGKFKDLLIHLNDDVTDRDIERFIIQSKAIDGYDIYDELDKIQCPVLVIGVDGDKVISPSSSKEIADKIGCELYMYGTEYGHAVFDEAPDYKQRIMDFFDK